MINLVYACKERDLLFWVPATGIRLPANCFWLM